MSGEETPCEECPDKPVALFASNALAWQAWAILNEMGRPFAVGMAVIPLHVPPDRMRLEVEARGGDEDDFDKVCMIERIMFPFVQKSYTKD